MQHLLHSSAVQLQALCAALLLLLLLRLLLLLLTCYTDATFTQHTILHALTYMLQSHLLARFDLNKLPLNTNPAYAR
jgi:hypothetical protein